MRSTKPKDTTQSKYDAEYNRRKQLVCAMEDRLVTKQEAIAQLCVWGYNQGRASTLVHTWWLDITNGDMPFDSRDRWWRRQ